MILLLNAIRKLPFYLNFPKWTLDSVAYGLLVDSEKDSEAKVKAKRLLKML